MYFDTCEDLYLRQNTMNPMPFGYQMQGIQMEGAQGQCMQPLSASPYNTQGAPQQNLYNMQGIAQQPAYNMQPIAPQQSPFNIPPTAGQMQIDMQQLGAQANIANLTNVEQQTMNLQSNIEYTQGYLSSKIGARIKVEFLIGTNMLVDREGTLLQVGISYIIIREIDTDDDLLCDIYSIKFVRFYY